MSIASITLYFREGGSDKVYQAAIEPAGPDMFNVTFAFGRRGGALKAGRKTNAPVPAAQAQRIYDGLVNEKLAKGYTQGEAGTPFQSSPDTAARVTGLVPQLPSSIEEVVAERLRADLRYVAQEKFDGVRMMLRWDGANAIGANRRGLQVALPKCVEEACRGTQAPFVLDGELVGDVFYAFDLLELADADLKTRPYSQRLEECDGLAFSKALGPSIQFALTAFGPLEKQLLIEQVRAVGGEGVVFKELSASYRPGRSETAALKWKFVATCSAVVTAANAGKRSVALELLDPAGTPVPVGNVTIPANRTVPNAGAVVEIRYLYAFRGGSLFQPVYLGERSDIEPAECRLDQLKYKGEGQTDEEEETSLRIPIERPRARESAMPTP